MYDDSRGQDLNLWQVNGVAFMLQFSDVEHVIHLIPPAALYIDAVRHAQRLGRYLLTVCSGGSIPTS